LGARKSRLRGTGREIPALLACLIWAFGFELAPALHALEHAAHVPHAHGAHEHTHDGDDAPDEHGEGSLAHRDLAARTPPPALPPIDPPLIGVVRFERAVTSEAPWRSLGRPRARAPPARTLA
jgi:hypothetical protein